MNNGGDSWIAELVGRQFVKWSPGIERRSFVMMPHLDQAAVIKKRILHRLKQIEDLTEQAEVLRKKVQQDSRMLKELQNAGCKKSE